MDLGFLMSRQLVLEFSTFGFRGPAYRILESKTNPIMNVRIQKKLDSPPTSLAFQGF
jgi:hypothetical protein